MSCIGLCRITGAEGLFNPFNIGFNEFRLYRDIGGSIYLTADSNAPYVFKLYKRAYTAKALKAVKVCAFLKENGFPIVNIIPTPGGDNFIEVDMPEGNRIGVLYEHLEGHTATADDITTLGTTASQLHHLLSKYPEPLPVIGKEYFIDCLIEELSAFGYDPTKIAELEPLGNELWEDVKDLPVGALHGLAHVIDDVLTECKVYAHVPFHTKAVGFCLRRHLLRCAEKE